MATNGDGRNGHGRFTPQQPDGEVIAAVRENDPAATSEVAEVLGVSRQAADKRLRSLAEAGEVETKKIGAVRVWYLPREADTRDHETPADAVEGPGRSEPPAPRETDTRGREAPEDSEVSGTNPEPRATGEADTRPATAVLEATGEAEDAIATLDLPGRGDRVEARREAIRAIYDYLRREGSATRSEIQEAGVVDVDATGYTEFYSFWTNCINTPEALRDLPGVDPPGEGEHRYYYTGE